jgi:peptidoglycan/xylan/chitin deacetylase (PgdA/CDA1 family)
VEWSKTIPTWREIASAGHEIGLHGYEHYDLSSCDTEALAPFDKTLPG